MTELFPVLFACLFWNFGTTHQSPFRNKADELCIFPENELWKLAQTVEFGNIA